MTAIRLPAKSPAKSSEQRARRLCQVAATPVATAPRMPVPGESSEAGLGSAAAELRYLPGLPYGDWQEEPLPRDGVSGPREGVAEGSSAMAGRMLAAEEERLLFRQMNLAFYRAAAVRNALQGGARDASRNAELTRLIRRGLEIRDRLFQSFYRLNLSIACRFVNRHNTFDDLVSEGQFTLLRAISRFDPERGFRFSTYAMHAIRRRLLRYIRTRHRQRLAARAWSEDLVPIDTTRWTAAYEQGMVTATAAVERLLSQLSSRERYVVRSRFGWGQEFEPRTLREIAAELGVSRERVRQLEERALKKLRGLAASLDVEI